MNKVQFTVAAMEALFGKVRVPELPALRPVIVRPYVRPRFEYTEGRCCAAAVVVSCVCRVSWSCATHGVTCVGSHD